MGLTTQMIVTWRIRCVVEEGAMSEQHTMTTLPERLQAVIGEMRSIAPTCENDWCDQLNEWTDRIEAALALQPSVGGDALPELPRVAEFRRRLEVANAALLEAHAIGGPARERAADEACRYLVNHFGDWIAAAIPTQPRTATQVDLLLNKEQN